MTSGAPNRRETRPAGDTTHPTAPSAGRRHSLLAHSVTTEYDLHLFTVQLLKLYGSVPWWHVPNGEFRSPRTGARLKRMGVRKGVADFSFMLPPKGQAAFLELKSRGGRMSDDQRVFQDDALKVGALYAVADTPEAVASILRYWGIIRTNPLAAIREERRAAA